MNESLTLPVDHSSFVVLLLLAYAGVAIDLLLKIQEWIKSVERPNVPLVILSTVISMLISTVLVYLREDIKEIFVVTKVGAVMLGFGAQTIFRKIVGTKTEKIVVEPLEVAIVEPNEKEDKNENE